MKYYYFTQSHRIYAVSSPQVDFEEYLRFRRYIKLELWNDIKELF